ncbi:ABC transporter permease [Burkholderia glumae]|uniref:ABC transporter permease n=1 Tax=Burkholderia glumae TaxID=337 RepID=UPI002150B3AB|nr:ABC transporter permease [Burkholderia glumae]UVS95920.1 FtsX-like permease family protein [Burkholderia glumae]
MNGLLRLAFRLLVNDSAKFTALTIGITFSVLLMIEMTSLFAGILNKASASVINIGAKVWVMDPAVQTIASSIGMPDYVLAAVRSVDGVKYAVPLYSGAALVRLRSGAYQPVSVIGLDDTSLLGSPTMSSGRIEDIYAENGFIAIDDTEFRKLGTPTIGTDFDLNDHRGVIVGIAKVAASGLFGTPTLYTTYARAVQYIPSPRFTISYILVEPKSPADIPRIKAAVSSLGYLAYTREEFIAQIARFYKYQTGFGTNILLMTVISFLIGLSISGQTFYAFILENLDKFGALEAIGANNRDLVTMILFQAAFTALTGYGIGVGLCVLLISLAKLQIPGYAALLTYGNLLLAAGMMVVIAAISSYLGVRRVLRIEPFDIFRS